MQAAFPDVREPGSWLCILNRITSLLRDRGAEQFPHAHQRALYEHLLGTREILGRWSQPASLQLAGLLHSIYSTDKYHRQLMGFSRRTEVRELAGSDAERIVFLFCVTSRNDFWNQLAQSAEVGEAGLRIKRHFGSQEMVEDVSREDVRSLIVLQMANAADQACASNGAPGRWLARASWMGSRLRQFEGPLPPVFSCCMDIIDDVEEGAARDAYRKGVDTVAENPSQAAQHFAEAVAACPHVAEPMIWKAYTCLRSGDSAGALQYILRARRTLMEWGVPWDKRLEFHDWMKFLALLERASEDSSRNDFRLSAGILKTADLYRSLKGLEPADCEDFRAFERPSACMQAGG
jgi:hypothetical protein